MRQYRICTVKLGFIHKLVNSNTRLAHICIPCACVVQTAAEFTKVAVGNMSWVPSLATVFEDARREVFIHRRVPHTCGYGRCEWAVQAMLVAMGVHVPGRHARIPFSHSSARVRSFDQASWQACTSWVGDGWRRTSICRKRPGNLDKIESCLDHSSLHIGICLHGACNSPRCRWHSSGPTLASVRSYAGFRCTHILPWSLERLEA